jgi:hypothetical protein
VGEDDGTAYLQVAKGGVFSYYEFSWPADDRLTDEKWRQMLDDGQAPPPPAWIESFFTSEGEYSELTEAVFRFQESLSMVVWSLNVEFASWSARGAALEQLGAKVEALRAEKRYEGRQLVSSEFRSFDRQAEDRAVIAVRETWQDALYDVTYTLERDETRWSVTRVVYANEPPAW